VNGESVPLSHHAVCLSLLSLFSQWEKHDILSWYFCEESSCKETRYGRDASGNATEAIQTHLDYAQETKEDGYVPYNTPRANETEGADLQPLSQKP
jgi:hypothetical protein|tara:strand:+ start:493 stop:780 length:288 start_codon:yes stop_codon:yes gene_type:complete